MSERGKTGFSSELISERAQAGVLCNKPVGRPLELHASPGVPSCRSLPHQSTSSEFQKKV